MTVQEFSDRIISWPTALGVIVGLLVAVLSLSGFARVEQLQAEERARIAADTTIVRLLNAREESLQRKLDCALFDLPKNCRSTMSPRGEP